MNSYSKIIKPNVQNLIKDNITLVKKIAWHLHGRVSSIIDIEDLIQIGMLGLISAAQNYVHHRKMHHFHHMPTLELKVKF